MTATVVYIAGYGRSGSTLLDLVLGRHEGWFSMGEFRLFWHAQRDGWQCGCGHPVGACPVWAGALDLAAVGDADDVIADLRSVVRTRHTAGLIVPALSGKLRPTIERAAATLGAVYGATAAASGARVLVDSSKDPLYGLLLRRAPGVRIHVVHLVRDPRAVAYSWQRARRRPEIADREAFMPTRSAVQTSLEWDLKNALVHALGTGGTTYERVTYESLVENPDAVMKSIVESVEGPRAGATERSEPDLTNHTVAGNPMRFDASRLRVEPDVEWRTALSRRDHRAVTALTWPLLRAYGYG